MTHRIEGWCIIDSRDGSRWGSLYESTAGAKRSYNDSIRYKNKYNPEQYPLFNDQDVYILNALVVIEGDEK